MSLQCRWANRCKGFSLVELIVAFAIIVIIFAAIVPQFRAIRNSWAGAEAGAAITQNARVLAEHITRNLSAATQIVGVSSGSDVSGFITFQDNSGSTKRYMLAGGYVVFGIVGSEEQLAGPVDRFRINCYSLNDLENPTAEANAIRLVRIETEFTNADALGTDKTFSSEVFIQANTRSASEQAVFDIFVKSGQPNTVFDYAGGDHGCNAVIEVDNRTSGSVVHGLLYFKDIVGDANGQIPQGTKITQAKIKLWYVNHNNDADVYFYRMTVPWTEMSTWNSIGGGVRPGINCDAGSVVTANLGNNVPETVEIDVTDIVRSWINGDYENYGFGIINSSNNNIQFAAAENTTGTGAHTPILEVRYHPFYEAGVAMKNYVDYGGNNAVFDSYRSSDGFYGGDNVSHNAVVAVNATGSDRIYLYSNAELYGDAYIGPGGNPSTGIRTVSGAAITGIRGTLDELMDFPNPLAPTGPPFSGSHEGNLELWGSMSRTINSNHYFNNMRLWDSSSVVIDGNVTILLERRLELADNASIKILSGSSLNLYVKRTCNIGGQLNAHYDKEPSDLKIYILGDNRTFNMYGNAEVYAMLDNPRGSITSWDSGQFYGRMKGKYLEGDGGIHIDLDSSFSGESQPEQEELQWTFGGGTIQGEEILP
jgi:prepilin-type N-terminal cleavage/methylation domain-containing protein